MTARYGAPADARTTAYNQRSDERDCGASACRDDAGEADSSGSKVTTTKKSDQRALIIDVGAISADTPAAPFDTVIPLVTDLLDDMRPAAQVGGSVAGASGETRPTATRGANGCRGETHVALSRHAGRRVVRDKPYACRFRRAHAHPWSAHVPVTFRVSPDGPFRLTVASHVDRAIRGWQGSATP